MRSRPPREWQTHQYYDPKGVLIELRKLAEMAHGSDIDAQTLRLRTRELRPYHQNRQAAIFCYGMGQAVLKTPVSVAHIEAEDFDCIAAWERGSERIFTPIQLKELAPEDLNPRASLESELAKLGKYASSPDLVVAFHLNRTVFVDFTTLTIPKLPIGELWFYGALSPTQDDWVLYGNALRVARSYAFSYPA
jgi:hypothetical protein